VRSRLGCSFEAADESLVDIDDAVVPGRILARGASLRAIHPEAGEIDLLTSISGFGSAELSEDATTFEVAGAEVRVGRLEELLQSKQASGRPKDLAFLEAFRARALDEES
jgi:predicted nucleotidyltransferase